MQHGVQCIAGSILEAWPDPPALHPHPFLPDVALKCASHALVSAGGVMVCRLRRKFYESYREPLFTVILLHLHWAVMLICE